ncbi:hypothetical protein METBIDRAFT_205825 [Metschnikowia bicuspidata var. bicuspidata NRRL YB-4993]|uniref:Uncharacterized protein n=1 Tax=Metschnikowia bicuspidata var. bicuspidata NRRL YB-4993 TaxID=869754 RepID=A0A1A0HA84_9ASCO|nr:hypothetical protein METBIDRAFT_205825 [Metschnikowia bicuspidata var. bicuspidata NRRL YB-4993]OBA20787.1 hypothetical protein METBIDRAFT_205825 [Metschnikowia bicuspidata var. bicuspidata NRRL YB-4993]
MLFLATALAGLGVACANRVLLDDNLNSQVCEGMYSKHDWGGSKLPHISIKLDRFNDHKLNSKNPVEYDDIELSYVIFEYKDIDKLGVQYGDSGRKKYICDDLALEAGVCSQSQYGSFIAGSDTANTTIQIAKLTQLGFANLTYPVTNTGYYCVSTFSTLSDAKYKGFVSFQNAFGQLSASEIPKLPAYGILTLCYAVTMALFGFQFFKRRNQNQILPLQRYLLAMLGFLTFDTLVVWSYYDLVNRTVGTNWFVKFYIVFMSIMSSAKFTFSFFLLLLIGLGYGVVLLKLSKKIMFRCKILAGVHFTASMLYLIGTYNNGGLNSNSSYSSIDAEADAPSLWMLFFLLPVTITMTTYYFLILSSIRNTTASLHKQRQVIKLQLYQNLFRIISLSLIIIFTGIVLTSFYFLSLSGTEAIEQNWRGSYFVVDFWLTITYFCIFLGVAWLWRPTETSYMLAVSQQLSTGEGEEGDGAFNTYQHGHEFELDDVSLMSHSDDENAQRDSFELDNLEIPQEEPPKYKEASHDDDHGTPVPNVSNTLFELGEEDVEDESRKSGEGRHSSPLDRRLS